MIVKALKNYVYFYNVIVFGIATKTTVNTKIGETIGTFTGKTYRDAAGYIYYEIISNRQQYSIFVNVEKGKKYYVWNEHVKLVKPAGSSGSGSSTTKIIFDKNAWVISTPSNVARIRRTAGVTSDNIIKDNIPTGTLVKLSGRTKGSWHEVYTGTGKAGWIHNSVITFTKPGSYSEGSNSHQGNNNTNPVNIPQDPVDFTSAGTGGSSISPLLLGLGAFIIGKKLLKK